MALDESHKIHGGLAFFNDLARDKRAGYDDLYDAISAVRDERAGRDDLCANCWLRTRETCHWTRWAGR